MKPSKGEKIKIGGIKFSNELVQINLVDDSGSKSYGSLLYQILAQNRINIAFLSITRVGERIRDSCCVARESRYRVKKLISDEPELEKRVEFIPGVGLLSLFPHKSSLEVLGLSLRSFGKAGLPLYGMSSSISALTFVTNYTDLDKAFSILTDFLDLPPNHTPVKPQIHVRFI